MSQDDILKLLAATPEQTALQSDLWKLPGIGRDISKLILSLRRKNYIDRQPFGSSWLLRLTDEGRQAAQELS